MHDDLGPVGIWTFAFDAAPAAVVEEMAAELDALGYGAIWLPEAIGRDPMVGAMLALGATERITVCTGVASIYARAAMTMTSAWKAIGEAYPGRFLLGVGVSHQVAVEGMRQQTRAPRDDARLPRRDGPVPLPRGAAGGGARPLPRRARPEDARARRRAHPGAHSYYVPPGRHHVRP